ncbi:hypothetical protein D3C80_2192390 [compost metagenome]
MNDVFAKMKSCQTVENPAQIRGADEKMPGSLLKGQRLAVMAADVGGNFCNQLVERMFGCSGL